MSFKKVRNIPSPEEIIDQVPLPLNLKKIKEARDVEITDIFTGKSNKFILIIGPCSADNEESVCEYVHKLAQVQEKVKNEIIIIPRIYTNKPRTTGEGYKGMLHQPDPNEAPNMVDGIISIRKMHIRTMSESGLSAADEMLYPDNFAYCGDMLSYVAVGARSVENQQHRLACSGIDLPVGMKNPTSGDLSVMFNSVQAAQASHSFIYQGSEVETSGNPISHGILRGSVSKHGESIPNYHYEDLTMCISMYKERNLQNPAIIVDTNHANSQKRFYEQPRIAKEILHSCRYNKDIADMIKGFMIESYLVEGNQGVKDGVYGKSITDACIGWNETENLIFNIAENL